MSKANGIVPRETSGGKAVASVSATSSSTATRSDSASTIRRTEQQPTTSPSPAPTQPPVYVILPPNSTVSQKRGLLTVAVLSLNAAIIGVVSVVLYLWPNATMRLYQSNLEQQMGEIASSQTRSLAAAMFTSEF
jgi:hypothetical protein